MNFTFYKNILSANQLTHELITQLKYGSLDNFIDQLPLNYKKVIQNNKIFFWSAEDHYYTLEPQPKWTEITEIDYSNKVSIEDVKQQFYDRFIKDSINILKDEFHTWRLKLIDFKDTKSEIDSVSEKLSYFESVAKDLDYLKPYYEDIEGSFMFLKQEIDKIKRHFLIESEIINTQTNYPFKLKDGAKVDIIRLLYALHDLKLIYNQDDSFPTQKEFMDYFGKLFNNNFDRYSAHINFNVPKETYLKIFEKLLKTATEQYNDKNK
ncbi:hypothetical protein [Emticicia aquatilis]|nr:hypothetical protein [Emticicia aquatilis]